MILTIIMYTTRIIYKWKMNDKLYIDILTGMAHHTTIESDYLIPGWNKL